MLAQLQSASLIFLLRTSDITLYTLRLLMMKRHLKVLAWIFAFCQSILYVNVIRVVMDDLGNWFNILGYGVGFATGLVVGMVMEGRLSIGYLQMRIISSGRGSQIAERLRQGGYGVTQIPAWGRDGEVDVIHTDIHRKDIDRLTSLIRSIDDDAFIAYEEVQPLQHGFWGK